MTSETFNQQYQEALDTVVVALAEHPEIPPDKFYTMTILVENLRFFGPVLYGAIKPAAKE